MYMQLFRVRFMIEGQQKQMEGSDVKCFKLHKEIQHDLENHLIC